MLASTAMPAVSPAKTENQCWCPVGRRCGGRLMHGILTGSNAPPIIGADAVTEMRQVKHAYETRSYGAAENRVLSTWYLVARKERWFG